MTARLDHLSCESDVVMTTLVGKHLSEFIRNDDLLVCRAFFKSPRTVRISADDLNWVIQAVNQTMLIIW